MTYEVDKRCKSQSWTVHTQSAQEPLMNTKEKRHTTISCMTKPRFTTTSDTTSIDEPVVNKDADCLAMYYVKTITIIIKREEKYRQRGRPKKWNSKEKYPAKAPRSSSYYQALGLLAVDAESS